MSTTPTPTATAPTGPVVTRFAPSPTGFLHVGGARTALYNWLFARKHGGKFLLRIEDTDQGRHVPEAEQAIFTAMQWLGLGWDEGPSGSNRTAAGEPGLGDGGPNGPYRQSERLEIYQRYFQKLVDAGSAYYCFMTKEEEAAARREAERQKRPYRYDRRGLRLREADIKTHLADGKPYVLRLKMPDEPLTVRDVIAGDVTKTPDALPDFVIRKADGWPTYHFGVVVDDALMGVTHVIRAKEHLENSHNHIALQRALGFATPVYGHLPIVLNADGSKMSKRNRGAKVEDYRDEGFLPEALVNYMALVGWSPGHNRELLTLEEMIAAFSLESISRNNGRWDIRKCRNFNARYIRERTEPSRLAELSGDWLRRRVDKWLPSFVTRMETIEEFVHTAMPLWVERYSFDAEAAAAHLSAESLGLLTDLAFRLASVDWKDTAIHAAMEGFAAERGAKLVAVAMPTRVALTGTTISPPVNETLARLGRDESLRRLAATVARFGGTAGAYAASRLSAAVGRWEDALTHIDTAAARLASSSESAEAVAGLASVVLPARAATLAEIGRADEAAAVARDAVKRFEGTAHTGRVAGLAAIALRQLAEDRDDVKSRNKAYEEVITLAGKAAEAGPTPSEKTAGLVLKGYGLHRIGKDEPAAKFFAPVAASLGRTLPADADAWQTLLAELGPRLPDRM